MKGYLMSSETRLKLLLAMELGFSVHIMNSKIATHAFCSLDVNGTDTTGSKDLRYDFLADEVAPLMSSMLPILIPRELRWRA